MIVVDSSAVVEALVAVPVRRDVVARLTGDDDLTAPDLIDVEVLHAIRGLVRGRKLRQSQALAATDDFADLPLLRYPSTALMRRIWQLRDTLTAYDAAYVALAEVLDVPLITCDRRLASASGHAAAIELFR